MIIITNGIVERECPYNLGEKVLYKGKKWKVVFREDWLGLCRQYFISIKRKGKIITVHENHLRKIEEKTT
ncbi:hypothetical protein [Acinetobacter baumannii]|uniref:hypothetical protein n=1 Tax=Acinetobacter baumannii TaxID=470 RepID=UPI0004F55AAA|nr:hypothetical protein [Acinetobacter baumannii]MCF1332666.1 hypothetical protein [Acinetobacter baumannii]HEM6664006.1 hypothetical protein [Acinetobacter baumannii]